MSEGTWMLMSSNSREGPVPVNSLFVTIPEREHEFFQAVRHSDMDEIQNYLQRGVDVNMKHSDGACILKVPSMFRQLRMTEYAPIHSAVAHCPEEVLETLVEAGADLNIQDGMGRTPLFVAVAVGRYDVVQFLISKGVDLNQQTESKRTALLEAVCNHNVRLVDLLLQAGADVNLADMKGTTALWGSVLSWNHDVTLINNLIKAGAKVNITNSYGATILMSLLSMKTQQMPAVLKCLIKAGANVNKVDYSGWSPLHFAVVNRCKEVILCILLASGASMELRDKNGLTPFDVAVQIPNRVAMEVLLRADCPRSPAVLEAPKVVLMAPHVPEFMEWLREELCTPRRLVRLCRESIRKHIAPDNLSKLQTLGLPITLENFVACKVLD